jgi:Zn-dependent peptidase ImmA (M78 family)
MQSRDDWSEPLVRRLIRDNGGKDPREIIRAYATARRKESEQDSLPIDVDTIRSVLGIRRREGDYDFAGRIYAQETGQVVMDLRSTDSYERQRFTCAHELIHPAFPGFKIESRYRLDTNVGGHQKARQEEEYLCDYGAAELLMPMELVVERYSTRGGLKDVERLHRQAEVSLEAAANRLIELADEPTILLVLEVTHKPADQKALRRGDQVEPRLRIRYCAAHDVDLFIPRFKSADEESALCRALEEPGFVRAMEPLPGTNAQFRIEAKDYSLAAQRRVIALAWPE